MKYSDFIVNSSFHSEFLAVEFFIKKQLKGLQCPQCKKLGKKIYHQKTRPRKAYCNICSNEFSIFKKTIFKNFRTDIRKLLYSVLVFDTAIKATDLRKEINVTHKTALRIIKVLDKENIFKIRPFKKQIKEAIDNVNISLEVIK